MTTEKESKANEHWGNYEFPVGHAPIINFFVDHAHHLGLNDSHCWLVTILMRYAFKKGKCSPSIDTLAKSMGRSRRHVINVIDDLEAKGLIEVIGNKGKQGTNIYKLDRLFAAVHKLHLDGVHLLDEENEEPRKKTAKASPEPEAKAAPPPAPPKVETVPRARPALSMGMDAVPTLKELLHMAALKDKWDREARKPEVKPEVRAQPVSEVKASETVEYPVDDFASVLRRTQTEELRSDLSVGTTPGYVQKFVVDLFSEGRLTMAQARTFVRDGMYKIEVDKPDDVQAWWGNYCKSMVLKAA